MNEDDGFTIVDETFGVREASDGSDGEEEISPQFGMTALPQPVQLQVQGGHDTRSVITQHKVEQKTAYLPGRTVSAGASKTRISHSIPVVVKSSVHGETGAVAELKEALAATGVDPEIGDDNFSAKLNNNSQIVEQAMRTNQIPGSATSDSAEDFGATCRRNSRGSANSVDARSRETVLKNVPEPTVSRTVVLGPPDEKRQEVDQNERHTITINSTGSRPSSSSPDAPKEDTATILHETRLRQVGRSAESTPGAQPLVTAGNKAREGLSDRQQRTHETLTTQHVTKRFTVRLLPGHCEYGAVISWTTAEDGARLGASAIVLELEKELQRNLRLRQPVRLTSVQVRTAIAHEEMLRCFLALPRFFLCPSLVTDTLVIASASCVVCFHYMYEYGSSNYDIIQ